MISIGFGVKLCFRTRLTRGYFFKLFGHLVLAFSGRDISAINSKAFVGTITT